MVPPTLIVVGLNDLVSVGCVLTTRQLGVMKFCSEETTVTLDAKFVNGIGFVEQSVFVWPGLLVTFAVNVQVTPGLMVRFATLTEVDPAANGAFDASVTTKPGQFAAAVPPTVPFASCSPAGSVSVNPVAVVTPAGGLAMVNVSTEVPPERIEVGLNDFVIPGWIRNELVNVHVTAVSAAASVRLPALSGIEFPVHARELA